MRILLSDIRYKVVPSIFEYILKACDVNKDIEINEMGQLTLPDIQISLAEKVFRAYVKQLGEKAVYRVEQSLTPNESISTALEKLRMYVRIDIDILSL